MSRRVALAGCFGFRNTGDDAILEAWLHDLTTYLEDISVVVLGGDDAYLRESFPEVAFVPWRDWPGTVQAVEAADLLVVAGGGLFHDYWAMEPGTFLKAPAWVGPMYYLSLIGLAKLFERPCVVTGVGIGPLRTETGRAYVREVLSWADAVTVRDTGSREVLQSAGFPEPDRVAVTADPVFRLPVVPARKHPGLDEALTPPVTRPLVGVAVRNWPGYPPPDQWLPELAQALQGVVRRTGGTVLFLPFQAYPVHPPTDDVEAARAVSRLMGEARNVRIVERYLPPRQADALVGACDVLVAMRLHAAVLALRHGVPCISLAYDPKVRHLMVDAGLDEFCFDLGDLRRDVLEPAILNVLDRPEAFRRHAGAYRQTAVQRTALHLEMVRNALQGDLLVRRPLSPVWAHWARPYLTHPARPESPPTSEADDAAAVERARIRAELDRFREEARRWASIQRTRGFRLLSMYWRMTDRIRYYGQRLVSRLRRQTAPAPVSPVTEATPIPSTPAAPAGRAEPTPDPAGPRSRSTRKVYLIAYSPFDPTGQTVYLGGAERYLIELTALIRETGYEVEIYQSAQGDWFRYFYDIPVYGLDTGGQTGALNETINEVLHRRVEPPDLTVYLDFSLAAPACFRPSIGISHGVFWDDPRFQGSTAQILENIEKITSCIRNLDCLVSVDTNTIQWVRTVAYPLTEKIVYIPNFVDPEVFRPRPPDWPKDDDTVVVLHPRRLYPPRGFDLLEAVVPRLAARYPHIVFAFVGQAHTERERQAVEALAEAYPGRVRWRVLPFERMPEAYWDADITVLPTRFAEGTSLACLEAMACGNAVVATPVGGLTDLILDGYNGLLVAPQVAALETALERLVEEPDLRTRLGIRARETATVFSIDRWRQAWRHVLRRFLST
ncbi:GDP-mannose-dependent alpha-(1-6)-phosphatidylinositol monomannoside mannosyltransferase [bacterium HR11]|nr:GDP-mannose-dependent alpha-(1-6)-phosphatidylinositol monomannoside mannosyltransferase [bacterium HR11]